MSRYQNQAIEFLAQNPEVEVFPPLLEDQNSHLTNIFWETAYEGNMLIPVAQLPPQQNIVFLALAIEANAQCHKMAPFIPAYAVHTNCDTYKQTRKNWSLLPQTEQIVDINIENFFGSITLELMQETLQLFQVKERSVTKLCKTLSKCATSYNLRDNNYQGFPVGTYAATLLSEMIQSRTDAFLWSVGVRFTRFANQRTLFFTKKQDIGQIIESLRAFFSMMGFKLPRDIRIQPKEGFGAVTFETSRINPYSASYGGPIYTQNLCDRIAEYYKLRGIRELDIRVDENSLYYPEQIIRQSFPILQYMKSEFVLIARYMINYINEESYVFEPHEHSRIQRSKNALRDEIAQAAVELFEKPRHTLLSTVNQAWAVELIALNLTPERIEFLQTILDFNTSPLVEYHIKH